MQSFLMLTKRNVKLFFKDKGLFFSSLITPIILLVLYATFLAKVYKDSFAGSMPEGFTLDEGIINGIVGGQLLASLLAVSCITVAFCANLIMVQDKVTGAKKDLLVSPIQSYKVSMAYYLGTLLNTLTISLIALFAGFIYLVATDGWYLSFGDVVLLIIDIFMLTMFGTALSSIVNSFLKTQGQMSAVGTIVSSGYGFICGAYMPISNFGTGLQRVLSFLPGTYGTALVKNHTLRGALNEMQNSGVPHEVIEGIKKSIDCSFNFFDKAVSVNAMYLVMIISIIVLISVYVLINFLRKKSKQV